MRFCTEKNKFIHIFCNPSSSRQNCRLVPLSLPVQMSNGLPVAGWLPVFGMTGVIAYLQAKKGNWLRRMICVLAVMAFIPILNSSFYMFNYAYYARWFYMPILMMT